MSKTEPKPPVVPVAAPAALPDLAAIKGAARLIAEAVPPTPQIRWPLLCERLGCEVWVKHENHTPIGSFKLRGGLVFLDHLRRTQPAVSAVVTATRGNHGQSIAFAAARLGLGAVVVVPHGNNPEKNAAMRALGAELIEHGADFDAAAEHAKSLAAERGLYAMPSFDRLLVLGVATYGYELFRACPDLDAVYVPVGLGSGICGTITARDALGHPARIIGTVAARADTYARSFMAGHTLSTDSADTVADGMAVRVPNADAFAIMQAGAERIVRVDEDAILDAVGAYLTDTHNLAEGAGAAPLAALMAERELMKGRRVGLVLSGGNLDRAVLRRVLDRPPAP